MRIGQLTDCYKPVINGVTNFIALHKKTLESWGHEVYVFTIGHEEYQDLEPNVIRSPAVPLSDTGYNLSFRYSPRARRLAEQMDVLHVHHPFLAGRQALRISRKVNVPIVFTNHTRYDLYARYYLPFVPAPLSENVLETYLPRFANQCDLVVAPCRHIAKRLKVMGVNTPIEVIPNGVEVKRIANPTAPLTKAALGLPEEACVAVFVGRVAAEKNVVFLLRAFSRAATKAPDLHLAIIGDGPQSEHIRELISWTGLAQRVHLVGAVPYEQVPNWLVMADFFVTASVSEVHPLALLEALAAGLPTLGILSPGIEDTIEEEKNGLLSPRDVDAFADRMTRLATDAELRARLAVGARRIRARFDIRRTSAQLLAHYERLVEERRRRKR